MLIINFPCFRVAEDFIAIYKNRQAEVNMNKRKLDARSTNLLKLLTGGRILGILKARLGFLKSPAKPTTHLILIAKAQVSQT